EEATEMFLVVTGRVSMSLRLPGDREAAVTTVGPSEVLGEIPLIDGGAHSATAQAAEATSLLTLGRGDFAALVLRGDPTALTLKRRIAGVACTRLREQLARLAASLEESEGGASAVEAPAAELEPSGP